MAKRPATVNEGEIVRGTRERLESEGVVTLSSIKPPSVREKIAERLVAEGFERTPKAVRRPLAAQLDAALQHGALIPLKSLNAHVRGASVAELSKLIAAAVTSGKAYKVLRGTAEVLCGPSAPVLAPEEVQELRAQLLTASKALEKVTKKPQLSLLATDVSEMLRPIASLVSKPIAAPAKETVDGLRSVLTAVDDARDAKTGLSFVPAVVGRLAPLLEPGMVMRREAAR